MFRGSTPTFTFKIPFDVSQIKNLYVSVKQKVDDNVIQVDKTIDQCDLQDDTISCKFTQEDTLKFNEYRNASVQLRVLTLDDTSLVSDVFTILVGEVLKEGVIK